MNKNLEIETSTEATQEFRKHRPLLKNIATALGSAGCTLVFVAVFLDFALEGTRFGIVVGLLAFSLILMAAGCVALVLSAIRERPGRAL